MRAAAIHTPNWSTSSYPQDADTTPMELSALGAHIDLCKGCRGRWFSLRCAAEALHDVVATRFVTTLVVVALALGAAAFLL